MYISGSTVAENGYIVATYWKNGVPVVLPRTNPSQAFAIAVQGSDVYAAGFYSSINARVAVYWKNGVPVEIADQASETIANGIAVNATDVYVVGSTYNPGLGRQEATLWKNGVTTKLKDQAIGSNAFGVAISGSDVYIVGEIYVPGKANVAAYWKNGVPVLLSLAEGLWSSASAIGIHGSDIYIVGTATSASGDINIARYWKNGSIATSGDGLSNSGASGIAFHGSDVIISGFKQTAASVTTPIYWVNGVARSLTYFVPYGNSSRATGVALDGDDLYITGNDINESAPYWKNGVAVPLKSDGDRGAFAFMGSSKCGNGAMGRTWFGKRWSER